MNYKLAKKLKDAGFPQERKLGGVVYFDGGKESQVVCEGQGYECDCTTPTIDGFGMSGVETVYCPSLSELIEAHEKKLFYLLRCTAEGYIDTTGDYWIAGDLLSCDKFGLDAFGQIGSTPEEAVANLWLALNKNENNL